MEEEETTLGEERPSSPPREGPDTSAEARQDALKEFFDAGKAGNWAAAEAAMEDYLALREE